MIKNISEVNFSGKKVLVRVDFNVEFDKFGKIRDTFRIDKTLPTIDYILNSGGKVILISHLGDPEKPAFEFSLQRIIYYLVEQGYKIKFFDDCLLPSIKEYLKRSDPREIIILENLRFYKQEKNNEQNFAQLLASLVDLYVNEAFSVSHRLHASVVAITKELPSYSGFLFDREIKVLDRVINLPQKPLTVILGGGKASSKIRFMEKFLYKADSLLLGGDLANYFLKPHQYLKESEILYLNNKKVHLPLDVVTVLNRDLNQVKIKSIKEIAPGDKIYDIGPETAKFFSEIIRDSKEIIWNGPMGVVEIPHFAQGTLKIGESVINSNGFKVIGGGETVMALRNFNLYSKINANTTYISVGGGATLQFLSGEKLPGIEALKSGF